MRLGFTLPSLMITLSLFMLAMVGALNLLGFVKGQSAQTEVDDIQQQITRISEFFSTRVSRGGGAIDAAGEAKGIQVCTLNANTSQCQRYNSSQAGRFCIALPTVLTSGGSSHVNVNGFRLHNKILQHRTSNRVNMATFNLNEFCTMADAWESLNNEDGLRINTIKLCQFSAGSVAAVRNDFQSDCPSILTSSPGSKMFWIAVFNATPNHMGGKAISLPRIIQVFNQTRVTTP